MKFLIFFSFILFQFTRSYSQDIGFKHIATSENTSNNFTVIDNSEINGKKDKLLFITHDYGGKYVNSPIGVWYTNNGKWSIFRQDKQSLDAGAKFNILVKSKNDKGVFMHKANSENISGHITTINNPILDGNPNAQLIVTQNWIDIGPYNNNPIGVYYSGGKWKIYNQNKVPIPLNAKFNIYVPSDNVLGHTTVSANKQMAHVTELNNKLSNANPNALLFVTQYWASVYNTHPVGVWYSNSKWTIYNEDRVALPENSKFFVLVLGKSQKQNSVSENVIKMCVPVSLKPESSDSKCENCEISSTSAGLTSSTAKMWKTGSTLRVRMDGGTPKIRSKVIQYANEWTRYANIRFNFIESGNAEIIVTFGNDHKSWSAIGTDAIDHLRRFAGNFTGQGTMHFGWLTDDSSETEFRRVILHEFGHALGFKHEQGHPHAAIPWDREKVYAYYGTPPNSWDRNIVDQQVFEKLKVSETQFSEYDKTSIMHYSVSNELTIGDFEIPWNTQLSEIDKAFARLVYPPGLVRGNKLKITVKTGTDDLRENSDAQIYVKLSKGATKEFTLSLNRREGWGRNQYKTIEIPLPVGASLGDLEKCTLKFYSGKQFFTDTQDNWDVNEIKIDWISADGMKVNISDISGSPFIRFKNTGQATVFDRYSGS